MRTFTFTGCGLPILSSLFPKPGLVVARIDYVCGANFLLGTCHLAGVILRAMTSGTFTYGFQFYALVTVGALMILPSLFCLRHAEGLAALNPSAKNHHNGAKNPRAQFRKPVKPDVISCSAMVAEPLCLLDCSGVADGAAAVIVRAEDAVLRRN
jgi:hypothetical protein